MDRRRAQLPPTICIRGRCPRLVSPGVRYQINRDSSDTRMIRGSYNVSVSRPWPSRATVRTVRHLGAWCGSHDEVQPVADGSNQRSHTHTNFKAARCASPASMCCLAKYIGRLSFGRITIARFTYHCNRPKRGYTSTDDGWLPQTVSASETTADTPGSRGSAFAAVVASSYRSIFFKSLN